VTKRGIFQEPHNMPWERRQRGGLYYYRHAKPNGCSRRIYLGKGTDAGAQAEQDAQARQRRQAEREALRAEQAQVAVADAALADFRIMVDLLTQAVLLAAGFRHHKGEWRRRRALTH